MRDMRKKTRKKTATKRTRKVAKKITTTKVTVSPTLQNLQKDTLLPVSRVWVRPASWGPIPPKNAGNWVYAQSQPIAVVSPAPLTTQPKDNHVIMMLENVLDDFYRSEYKSPLPNVYTTLNERSAKPTDVREAMEKYRGLLDDLKDPKAKEGYAHLTRNKKSSYVTFLEKILADCELYIGNNRKATKTRKVRLRKRKVKSADQLTSKVQFKAEDASLKLVSVSPSSIVGAKAVWLYNTKRRRLTFLAAGGEGTLQVKGTTILRFDPKESKCKRLRKPEMIHDLMTGTKAYALKQFDKLKVKEISAKGRINKDTMVLKVIK
jgi:hypothetical protein